MRKLIVVLIIITFCGSALYMINIDRIDKYRSRLYFKYQKRLVQGSVEEQEYLDKAIKLDSGYADAFMEKSVSYNKRGRYDIGFKLLNKAVELDSLGYLGYRGFLKLYMLRDYAGAIEDFLILDTLTPGVRDAPWGEDIYKVLGVAYLKKGDSVNAEYYLNKAVHMESGIEWVEPRAILYRGVLAYNKDDFDNALRFFNLLLEHNPFNPEAYYYQAKIHLVQNRPELALTAISNCMKLNSYIETNPYFELPYQLYVSDISQLRDSILKKTLNGN